MLKPLKIFLVFSLISFTQSLFSKDAPPEHFRVPKSTLDALERKLKEETDPSKRVQLLLRWVKNKEDYEQSLLEKKLGVEKASEQKNGDQLALFKGFKVDIVTRLQTEIADLAKHPKLNLDPLYHVLGFRLLELQKYPEAVMAFQKISGKTSEDFMGLGDAYFAAKNTRAALDAFEHGGLDSKYRNTAGYKRAWCFLQLSDFQNALAEFDIALEDNPYNTIKLKEEVFRDRLRPYVETYQKLIFDDEELLNLKKLASRVHPEALEKSKELLAAGLKALILNFNAKAQIEKAQAVFGYLTKEIKDPLSVLVLAAPIWIKVYRGQLNHEAVEKITDSLPSKKIEGFDTTLLETELYNSVVFYDTLFKEDNLPTTRKLLFKINKKFFQLFPGNQQADPLRVGYAKLLLEDGDPAECIQILSARKRGDKEVEDLALSLDAKCELKQLDQLYQEPHAEFFYAKLRQNLFEKKIYERIDLGLPSESAFENLGRMLIGAINKNPKMPYLRDMLFQLNSNYPYSKETKLYTDLQVLLADLTFQEILESKDGNDVRSKRFFAVFDSAPKGSDVSKKSILNGVLIGKDVQILDRCDTFLKLYPAEFKPSKEVFDRCIRLAEQYVNLEREYSFWVSAEKELNDSQRLKFGLIELALNKTQGRKRILNLPTPASKSALQLWDGIETSKAPEKEDPRLNRLLKNAKIFRERLKPIKFSLIRSVVPARIKDFEQLDLLAVELYKSKPAPDSMAKILEMRAGIALSMRDFIKNLPAPDGLTPEELKQYQAKTNEVLKVWEDGAVHRNQECGEVAHSLSMDFKVAEKTICPEQTLSSTFNLAIQKWESTRQTSPNQAPWKDGDVIEKGESVGFLLDAGAKAKEPIRSRYFYIRALDLSQNDYDRARAYLALAKLMNKDTFWESAAALDGNLVEPIQWWRKKATGNPYFERLYDKMIGSVK